MGLGAVQGARSGAPGTCPLGPLVGGGSHSQSPPGWPGAQLGLTGGMMGEQCCTLGGLSWGALDHWNR